MDYAKFRGGGGGNKKKQIQDCRLMVEWGQRTTKEIKARYVQVIRPGHKNVH